MIQSMFLIHPLLTYTSFNDTGVMFKYMIFTGRKMSRSASWSYSYLSRKYRSYSMPIQHYRRAYSEWILNNFHRSSKFELTSSEKELQLKQISESIPICDHTFLIERSRKYSTDEYSDEWIVVLNRSGYIKRALNIMTDLSIVDYPPKEYENILS